MKNFDIIEGYFFGTIIFCFTIFLFTMFLVFMAALGMELSGINCHKSASMKKLEYSTWVKDSVLVPVEDANGNIKYVPNTKIRIIQEIKQ
jgi:hypothetical protein